MTKPKIIPIERLDDLATELRDGTLIQNRWLLPSYRSDPTIEGTINIGHAHGSGYVGAEIQIPYGSNQSTEIIQKIETMARENGLTMRYGTHHIDDTGSDVGFYCLRK